MTTARVWMVLIPCFLFIAVLHCSPSMPGLRGFPLRGGHRKRSSVEGRTGRGKEPFGLVRSDPVFALVLKSNLDRVEAGDVVEPTTPVFLDAESMIPSRFDPVGRVDLIHGETLLSPTKPEGQAKLVLG